MDQDKSKKIAVLIFVVAIIGFFSSMAYFGLFGTRIEYGNAAYMFKLACAFGFIVLGLFFGTYFYAGRKVAIRIGGRTAALMLIAYLLGSLLHR